MGEGGGEVRSGVREEITLAPWSIEGPEKCGGVQISLVI